MTNIFSQQVTSLINLDVKGLTNEKAMTRFLKRNQLHTKKKLKVLHRSIFPCARRLPYPEEDWGTVVAKEGGNHNFIKQSQKNSHFLSNFCSYCVISCTEVVNIGTTAKFLQRNFSAIVMSVIVLIWVQLEFFFRLGTATSLSVWIRTRLKIASYILLESGWTHFLSQPTLTW